MSDILHPSEDQTQASEQFQKSGFVVLESVFRPKFIDELRAEYERQFLDVAAAPDRYIVGKQRVQVTMQLKGPFLSPDLYANPAVLRFANAVLGEDIVIDNFSLVTALPGAPAQHLHTDHPDLFPGHSVARAVMPSYAVNVAIPLVDLTPQTGTTKLFNGSHHRPLNEEEFEHPYIARGSCYVVDYRLHHQGTENHSTTERPIVYLAYSRPWFTDITNYGDNVRIRIAPGNLRDIPASFRPLFRRLAAKGAFDRTIKELFS